MTSTRPESACDVAQRVRSVRLTGFTDCMIEVTVCGEPVRSTLTHPYWLVGRGWTLASALAPGDLLVGPNNEPIRIEDVQVIQLEIPVPVYDLDIEGADWFRVGVCGVLVHNS